MICPKCASIKTKVSETDKSGPIVKRVRRCTECNYVWRTKEVPIFNLLEKEEVDAYAKYINSELAEGKE